MKVVERNRYLAEIADHLPNGFFYQLRANGAEREFLFCSNGVERVFGVTADAVRQNADAIYGRILPEVAPQVAAAEAASIASGQPFLLEIPIIGPRGAGWIQVSSAKRFRSDGLEVWEGLVLDITEMRHAQSERERAERRLELAAAAADIGIWNWDIATGDFYYSPRARSIYGFSTDEPITFELLQRRTHPEDYAKIEPVLASALDPAVGGRQHYRYRITRADTGEQRWLQAFGEASFAGHDGGLKPVSYTGTLQDITEAVATEHALEEDRARLKLALEAGHLAVWELDLRTSVVTPSPALNELYRFPADAHPTLDDFRALYAAGERARVELESAERFGRGETALDFEAKHVWPDGVTKWIGVRAQIILDRSGQPERILGVATDVTERRRYEEQLLTTAQELQHRIKNTLAVVQTLATQTMRSGKPIEAALADLNGRLQALARSSDLVTRPDALGATVEELAREVTSPFRRTDGTEQFRFDGPEVRLSDKAAVSLGLALHELCTNAVKYGALSVECGHIQLTWNRLRERLDLTWTEHGGPPVVSPERNGFGTRLLTRGLLQPPNGEVELQFRPGGLECRLWMTLTNHVSRPE
jgi:PAS domain S-box-containing protein